MTEAETAAAKTIADRKQDAEQQRQAARKKWGIGVLSLVAFGAIAGGAWWLLKPKQLEAGFISGNGRIEATEIEVAPKQPGRIAAILVKEGDFVKSGEVVAQMDVKTLTAQRAEASANVARAESAVMIAQSQVAQQQSSAAAAASAVLQRRAELNVAIKRLARSETLSKEGAASQQEYDNDLAGQQGSAAAVTAAIAQLAATEATIVTARAQVTGAQAGVTAAVATIARIDADIEDSALKSPLDSRVQYRVAQPNEVVAAGGIVLDLVDLTDVYMTLFLPDAAVGKVAVGAEVRIVLDAAPQFVIPARVSFLADVAQFTPKSVETQSERQKLMFRIRAQIDPQLLRRLVRQVKTGLPGIAYVRLEASKAWPDRLAVHEPD
jgi:HlyD family secretion protein